MTSKWVTYFSQPILYDLSSTHYINDSCLLTQNDLKEAIILEIRNIRESVSLYVCVQKSCINQQRKYN